MGTDEDTDDTIPAPLLPINRGAVELRVDPGMSWPEEMEGEDGLWAVTARQAFDRASQVFAGYTTVRATNETNRLLSPEGRQAANREWADKALPDLTKRLETIRQEARDLEAKTLPSLVETVMKRPEDPAGIAEAQEIRAFLRALPDAERMDKLEFLVRQGDTTALRAVVSAPSYLTGLDDNVVALLRDDVVRKAHPERYARIEKLRKALKSTERALDGVIRYLTHDPAESALPAYVPQNAGSRSRRSIPA